MISLFYNDKAALWGYLQPREVPIFREKSEYAQKEITSQSD